MGLIPKKEVAVIRKSEGKYLEGEWIEGYNESFVIKASVQATSAKTLQTLPEGKRVGEIYTLYTDSELLIDDRVYLNGKEFVVIKVAAWQNFKATSHYQAVVTKSLKNEY